MMGSGKLLVCFFVPVLDGQPFFFFFFVRGRPGVNSDFESGPSIFVWRRQN